MHKTSQPLPFKGKLAIWFINLKKKSLFWYFTVSTDDPEFTSLRIYFFKARKTNKYLK